MKAHVIVGTALLALGLGTATGAAAMNLQPGMLTMMQQGGIEHGVQVGCTLPGYDPQYTCSQGRNGRFQGAQRRFDERAVRPGRY